MPIGINVTFHRMPIGNFCHVPAAVGLHSDVFSISVPARHYIKQQTFNHGKMFGIAIQIIQTTIAAFRPFAMTDLTAAAPGASTGERTFDAVRFLLVDREEAQCGFLICFLHLE